MKKLHKTARHKIIVAGHVALDITPSFAGSYAGKALNEIIKPGKLVNVGKAEFTPGGCVTNTGMALHTFGADVILVAKIGNDIFGRIIVEKYCALGNEPRFIVSEQEDTSYTIVIAPPDCDRVFFHDSAANHGFTGSDISNDLLEQAQYFHFGYPTIMRGFYKNDGAELVSLYKRVKEHGLVTSMDMAAIDPEGEAAAVDWVKILQNTLPFVDFFVPSIEELCFMLDRKKYEEWQTRANGRDICTALSLEKDVKPLAKKALELGCRALLLKCGAAGLYLETGDRETMCKISPNFDGHRWENISRFEKSFVPDRILSATGAGDTAIAAFLYGLSSNFSPGECLALAAGSGASCITEYDTLSGLLSIEDLKKKIEEGWEKQNYISV